MGWGSDKAGFGNVGKELETELTATDRVKTTFCGDADRKNSKQEEAGFLSILPDSL